MSRATAILATVVLSLIGYAVMSPATGQDRTEERLSALETRVAVLEEAAATVPSAGATPASLYVLNGEIALFGQGNIGLHGAFGDPDTTCFGRGGYEDIREGTGVTVRDQDGQVIGVGSLEPGTVEGSTLGRCDFQFAVRDLPTSPFYSVEVSHRGELTYSFEDLEAMNWSLALEIGD